MAELVGQVPDDLLVMGNVSPSAQFLGGTPESIREDPGRDVRLLPGASQLCDFLRL